MAVPISIPKGTRDFLPAVMARRNFIFDTLKEVFRLYGYRQIETPSMENLSTLLGKYGDEGDKLLFRILNSGNYTQGISSEEFLSGQLASLSSRLCEKGLRYDLTVPLARFVVMYRNELTFPFRRFQIQPVWRADRPQKGRYREFYQCDVDVIGSDSLLNEYEMLCIINEVFKRLRLKVTIKVNNRKILTGLAEMSGHPDKIIPLTVAIDKLEKAGREAVEKELLSAGFSNNQISDLFAFLEISSSCSDFGDIYHKLNQKSLPEVLVKGLNEMREVFSYVSQTPLSCNLKADFFLARGLSYYTGTILEVASDEIQFGSICGGGRYDDLTGVFGLPGFSGMGMSFGADRIYDIMDQLGRFDENKIQGTRALVTCLDEKSLEMALQTLALLRENNIAAELYTDHQHKMKKQFGYADSLKIPFVIVIGENELQNNMLTIKNMITGEQKTVPFDEIVDILSK
jgi:histidyl-tRNA synthetase